MNFQKVGLENFVHIVQRLSTSLCLTLPCSVILNVRETIHLYFNLSSVISSSLAVSPFDLIALVHLCWKLGSCLIYSKLARHSNYDHCCCITVEKYWEEYNSRPFWNNSCFFSPQNWFYLILNFVWFGLVDVPLFVPDSIYLEECLAQISSRTLNKWADISMPNQ